MTKPALHTKVIVKPEIDAQEKYTGIVFEVIEHGRTNIVIQAVGPGAAQLGPRNRLRVKPQYVAAAPDGYDAHSTATSSLLPLYSPILLGAVFTVPEGTLRGVDESTLLVVIGTNGPAYKAVRLGGDRDRYFKSVARAAMTEIPLHEVGERLNG